jgi:ribosomal protein L30
MTSKYYKITLLRSMIGLPKQKKDLLQKTLGLKKRLSTVYRPICNQVAGQVLAVKELVKIELIDHEPPTKEQAKQARKPTKGYVILGKMNALGEII